MSHDFDKMLKLAIEAREHAHTPYVNFKVGACIRTTEDHYFAACNVQNASSPLSLCAEACAIGQMIPAGDKDIAEILVVADSEELCAPCGGCRQQIFEFANKDTLVHLCNLQGEHKSMSIDELLPASFSAKTMEK